MFKNLFIAASFSLLLASVCLAETQKIGVVDLQKAISSSQAGKAAQDEYQKELKDAQAKVDAKKAELDKLQSELEKQAATLSTEAKLEKQEKGIQIKKDLDRAVQDSQEILRRRNNQLVNTLVKDLRDVIEAYGQKEGFTIIVEKSGQSVLYANNQIDVTDQIVKQFDSKSKK